MSKTTTTDFSYFRANMQYLMDSRGINLYKIQADCDIPVPTLSRYLTGQREPKISNVILLCKYFHVSLDWLMGLDSINGPTQNTQSKLNELYDAASDNDKKIVDLILDKYDK